MGSSSGMTHIEKVIGGPEKALIPKVKGEVTSVRSNAGFFTKLNGQRG